MAVWQVGFHLVPRSLVAASSIPPSTLNDTDWWATVAFPSDYQARLANLAPPAPYSDANLESWGREDGNRVDVRSARGRVMRAMVWVDVRRLDSKFGAGLLDFARRAGAVLVRSDGLVLDGTINSYAGALRSSDAWPFASDTAAFLAANSADDDDD